MFKKTVRTNKWIQQIAGYKANTEKSVAFLSTNNEQTEKEIVKTVPLITASKRIKYLGINLPKEVKDIQWKLQNISERN